jgi:hypothetical protein
MFQKENLFDVDYLNSKQQIIKSVNRSIGENHSSKSGYDVYYSVKYFFYTDTLLLYSITVNITDRTIYKTTYQYNDKKKIGYECYSFGHKFMKDTIMKMISQDIYLNYPYKFPTKNLILESKEVKKYENNKIIYKCCSERFGKLKSAIPSREDFYKYNEKGQIIVHISNPKSDAGGTAFLKQTFEYNELGNLVRKEWYENTLHQATDEYIYSDSNIVYKRRYYDIYGSGDKTRVSSESSSVYKMNKNGDYFDESARKRKFPNVIIEE